MASGRGADPLGRGPAPSRPRSGAIASAAIGLYHRHSCTRTGRAHGPRFWTSEAKRVVCILRHAARQNKLCVERRGSRSSVFHHACGSAGRRGEVPALAAGLSLARKPTRAVLARVVTDGALVWGGLGVESCPPCGAVFCRHTVGSGQGCLGFDTRDRGAGRAPWVAQFAILD